MFTSLIKSWKTSLAGFIGVVAILMSQGMTPKAAVLAAVIQLLGAVAGDHGKVN